LDQSVDRSLISARLRDALVAIGLSQPVVNVRQVAALEGQASGKLQRFLPRRS
jgi:hypothetical protein